MKLYIEGLSSIYETEQLTRMFYRQTEVVTGRRKKAGCIVARVNNYAFLAFFIKIYIHILVH